MGDASILAHATIAGRRCLLLWGTTTLLVWPYVRWRFEASCSDAVCFNDTIAGVPATYFGLLSIFLTVSAGVLTIDAPTIKCSRCGPNGAAWNMERNPYCHLRPHTELDDDDRPFAEMLRRQSEGDEAMQAQASGFFGGARNTRMEQCLRANAGTKTRTHPNVLVHRRGRHAKPAT